MLELSSVSIKIGQKSIVEDVNLTLETGDIGCLLGPSGCGKTTTLRAIAGFNRLYSGRLNIGQGSTISAEHHIEVQQRGVGIVFQDYALYPHLSVADNIRFGLHGQSKAAQSTRLAELLELIKLEALANKYPHQLSGGQQQRVALARALAPKPSVLLLDEPFSNLDRALRETLASDVRALLKATNTTALLVTHDQNEAATIADKIGVMQAGRLVQYATVNELYQHPETPFVAEFLSLGAVVGTERLNGLFASMAANDATHVLVRADELAMAENGPITALVSARQFIGERYRYQCQVSDEQGTFELWCNSVQTLTVGQQIRLAYQPTPHPVCFTR